MRKRYFALVVFNAFLEAWCAADTYPGHADLPIPVPWFVYALSVPVFVGLSIREWRRVPCS